VFTTCGTARVFRRRVCCVPRLAPRPGTATVVSCTRPRYVDLTRCDCHRVFPRRVMQDELDTHAELGSSEFAELQVLLAAATFRHVPRGAKPLHQRVSDFITQILLPNACRSSVTEWRQRLQVGVHAGGLVVFVAGKTHTLALACWLQDPTVKAVFRQYRRPLHSMFTLYAGKARAVSIMSIVRLLKVRSHTWAGHTAS